MPHLPWLARILFQSDSAQLRQNKRRLTAAAHDYFVRLFRGLIEIVEQHAMRVSMLPPLDA
jgi:hypothetical protein